MAIVAKVAHGRRDLATEHAITQRVAGEGIVEPLALVDSDEGRALIQKRFGDATLAAVLRAGRPSLARVLRFGLSLARALTRVHAARVINRDIKPSNVLIDTQSDRVLIADFGVAAELPVGSYRLPVTDLVGTPAYVSPEQTGRTHEGADARSDLYSLGVLLYEALTGAPPFEGSDTLELLAAHLSRAPEPPCDRVRAIPRALSNLVMKLLAKAPDERYQTAAGLAADLERCLEALTKGGQIADFALGGSDAVPLKLPSRLFGRSAEIAQLQAGLERATAGSPALVLVRGAEGSDPEAFVQTFARDAGAKVLWATGAFGGPTREPLTGLCDALRELASRLLLLENQALETMRRSLRDRLGEIGRVIVDAVPAFHALLGPQEALPELGAAQSRARFQLAFRRLFAALTESSVLVLALGRFDQADPSSRALLAALLDSSDAGKVLIVLTAPLTHDFGDLAPRAAASLVLPALPVNAYTEWLAAVLECDLERARPLADVLHPQTRGELVFLEHLIEHLIQTRVIHRIEDHWTWTRSAVTDAPPPPTLAGLAAARVAQLPSEQRQALKAMSCHGEATDADTLAVMLQWSPEIATERLAAVTREGLAVKRADGYVIAHAVIADTLLAEIPAETQRGLHTRLATQWLSVMSDAELKAHLPKVARALQRSDRLESQAHCLRAAASLRDAAEQAIGSTAYDTAQAWFEAGLAMLGPSTDESQRELRFSLEIGRARAMSMRGENVEAEAQFARLCQRELKPHEIAIAYSGRAENFLGTLQRERAVETGLEGLRRLGVHLPKHPSELRPVPALLKNQYRLSKLAIADILARPECKDERAKAVGDLIAQMIAPAFFFDSNLFVLLNEVDLAYYLDYGHTSPAVFLMGTHAMVLQGAFGKYGPAYKLIGAVDQLFENRPAPEFVAKALVSGYYFTVPFYRPWREVAARLGEGVQRGLETGDVIFAAYCAVCELNLHCMGGAPLAYVAERCETHARSGAKGEGAVVTYMKLVGKIAETVVAGRDVEAADLAPILAVSRAAGSIRNDAMTSLGLAMLAAGHETTVREWVADIRKDFEKVCFAAATKVELWQLEGYLAVRDALAGDRAGLRAARRALAKMRALRAKTRIPIEAHMLFLEAGIARARGDTATAAERYGQAAAAAQENQYLQLVAFALEHRADLLKSVGRADEARLFFAEASSAYQRWGHAIKVRELAAHAAPAVAAGAAAAGTIDRTTAPRSTTAHTHTNEAIDLGTILKVSQQISAQLRAAEVMRDVLTGVAENAGAERAVLVWRGPNGEERVSAEFDAGQYRELGLPLEEYSNLPSSLVRLVRRNGKAVVVQDASRDPAFSADEFVRAHKCRSLACVPIARKGNAVGCVVLENRLVAGAFGGHLVDIAQALLTQAAISLDNAMLYEEMEARVAERTAALHDRNREMRFVLDNVSQGLVVCNRDGKLSEERSAVVATWFEQGIPHTLAELFEQYDPAGKGWFEIAWEQLLDGTMPIEVSCHQLPKALTVGSRELELLWQPIVDGAGAFAHMLVVMSDVTEVRAQQRAELEQMEAFALFERLTRDRDGVIEFVNEATQIVSELQMACRSLEEDRRLVHTLKGNFALFGLTSMSGRCHQLETNMADERRTLTQDERTSLAAQWTTKRARFQRFLTVDTSMLQVYRQDYESALAALRRDGHPLVHDLEIWSFEPLKVRLERISAQANALAERLGKAPIDIVIEHGGIRLAAEPWRRFWAAFVHAVRNALDHGLETPAERAAAGKGRATLRLVARLEEGKFAVEVSDDGRGIQWERLREKARAAGMPAETKADLTRALFSDGISTRDEVGETSGRGVGMSALAEVCATMGGEITVSSEALRGTTIRFVFPDQQVHVLRERWVSIPAAAVRRSRWPVSIGPHRA